MKFRSWGITIGLMALLFSAYVLDHLGAGMLPPTNALEELGNPSVHGDILHGCDASQGSSIGLLVPDQTTPRSEFPLSQVTPAYSIPRSDWSARAGFSVATATDPEHWASKLGSAWYLDWNVRADIPANGLQHWQMVRVHEDCITPAPEAIQSIAALVPGQVWIIGNEPDVIWQDNVTPEKYAIFYHELYYLIKASDPDALIAVGGISQSTPLRLKYLDRVLLTYYKIYNEPMPMDWWTVHGYVLREQKNSWGVEIPPGFEVIQGELYEIGDHGRLDLFESQLVSFRHWMAEHGYQHIPLALTEFGILMPASYGFPSETIANYLEETFTWLYQSQDTSIGYPGDGYHLVQKWAWFSISDPTYSSSNLADLSSNGLTIIGERFRKVVSSMEAR